MAENKTNQPSGFFIRKVPLETKLKFSNYARRRGIEQWQLFQEMVDALPLVAE